MGRGVGSGAAAPRPAQLRRDRLPRPPQHARGCAPWRAPPAPPLGVTLGSRRPRTEGETGWGRWQGEA